MPTDEDPSAQHLRDQDGARGSKETRSPRWLRHDVKKSKNNTDTVAVCLCALPQLALGMVPCQDRGD
ncbi:unnamed protein product [Arctogadus glacialis]